VHVKKVVEMSAPVVLFVYNRLEHTAKTIDALRNNYLADQTDLFIYSDAAKVEYIESSVLSVRQYFKTIHGFKTVTVFEHSENHGLAKSIIGGVTDICEKFGRVIVLEDDIVTSPHFLTYMNDALNTYESNDLVMSVSGCNYPVDLSGLPEESYFLRIPLCWGWATWQSRWIKYSKDAEVGIKQSKKITHYMDFDGTHHFSNQLTLNRIGKINTWFIYWYLLAAKNKKLTLFPKFSLVNNIGHDGSGVHCANSNNTATTAHPDRIGVMPQEAVESVAALDLHKTYFKSLKRPFLFRAFSKILRGLKHVFGQ